jgi:hypothetical protein
MKLSAHYVKASIIITITVLCIGAVIYFVAINYISRNQIDRALTEEIEELTAYVHTHQQLPEKIDFDEDQTVFTKTSKKITGRRFFDTVYNNPHEKRNENGRAVESGITLGNIDYKVVITVSKESTEYLIQFITIIKKKCR